MKNIRKILVIGFIVISVLIMMIITRGSYLEYKELGDSYVSIFKINSIYRWTIMIANFVLTFFIMYFTNRGIRKGLQVFFDEEKKEMPKLINKSISLVIATATSIFASIVFTPKIILFASNVSFEKTDLIFNLDISFYMFIEPLIKMGLKYIIGIFVFLALYSIIYYIGVFNKYFDGIDKETLKNSVLMKHLERYVKFIAIFFAIYTLVGTIDIVFDTFITTNGGIHLVGAGVIDITIKIATNILLSIIIVITAFLVTSNLKMHNKEKTIKSLLIIPSYLVIMFIIMFGFDIIFVNSNKYDKEKTYIERNISYTRNAYGIDAEDETIEYSGTITTDEINENREILDNAVIINKDMVLDKLNSEQVEKGYYTYKTAGLSMYNVYENMKYLSPREIKSNSRTYNSKTFEYTHGYGAIVTSATSTTEDGVIQYELDEKIIKNPQIYYGLNTDNVACINENIEDEYDYTDSKGVEHLSTYKGESGLKLNWLDRFVLGITTKDLGIAFGGNVNKDTKILPNRNILQRAKLVLSDVLFDENPYVVVNDQGEMYWVLDAYTISSNYPYSTYSTIRYNGERKTINYIRNSIKVIINCYDGNMKFYITDTTDPIAMAYRKIYPNVFENLDEKIPEDISKNFVYPKFLYDIQSSMLEEYHNTKAEVLYRSDDSWKKAVYITTQNNKTTTTTLDSYYTMVQDGKIGLIQMYSPSQKQNLTAYLVGINENGTNKLKISRLLSNESILGLTQLDSKISEDETMKQEIDSLSVIGAKVTKRIMVVPVKNTILYIEQIYQSKTNENDKTPLLKKVIVASGNKMALGNNLKESLENIVSQEATSIDTYTTEDIDGIIQNIIKANKNLENSMNAKDWDLMGSDIKNLQELIKKLEEEKNKQDKSNVKPSNINTTTENANANLTKDNTSVINMQTQIENKVSE